MCLTGAHDENCVSALSVREDTARAVKPDLYSVHDTDDEVHVSFGIDTAAAAVAAASTREYPARQQEEYNKNDESRDALHGKRRT